MGSRYGFQLRTFISLLQAVASAVLLMSAVAVYIKPEGSVARALDWTFLALSKGQWEAVHTTVGLCFVLVSAFHLGLNWNAFTNYLQRTFAGSLNARREGILAVLIVGLVVALTLAAVPPFSSVSDLGNEIKAHWKSQVEER